jgi:outer membrane protein assembly factor BamB
MLPPFEDNEVGMTVGSGIWTNGARRARATTFGLALGAAFALALAPTAGRAKAPAAAAASAPAPTRAAPAPAARPAARAASSAASAGAAAGPRDPLEGRWAGHAGPADNQATVGLEIVRDGDDLVAYATTDLAHAWRQPAGPVQPIDQAGHYAMAGGRITLTLSGTTLEATGFLHDPAEAVSLQRTTTLPTAPARPTLPRGPGPAWQVHLGGSVFAPAAVDDQAVYVGTVDGVFCARRLIDGSLMWRLSTGRPFMGEALADADGIFVANDNGRFYRLDRATGQALWQRDLGDASVGRVMPNPMVSDFDTPGAAPLRAGDLVLVGSRDGSVQAMSVADGTLMWRAPMGSRVRTGLVLAGRNVIATTMAGHVVALSTYDGAAKWTFDAKAEIASPPAFVGDLVIVGTRDSMLYALDAATGKQVWSQYFWGSWVESAAVGFQGVAYIGSGDLERVNAIDPATGRNTWRTEVGGWVMQRPAVTADSVYASVAGAHRTGDFWSVQTGGIAALDRANGKLRWFWPLPDAPSLFLHGAFAAPVVAAPKGGKPLVIVGGLDGTLYAFPAD